MQRVGAAHGAGCRGAVVLRREGHKGGQVICRRREDPPARNILSTLLQRMARLRAAGCTVRVRVRADIIVQCGHAGCIVHYPTPPPSPALLPQLALRCGTAYALAGRMTGTICSDGTNMLRHNLEGRPARANMVRARLHTCRPHVYIRAQCRHRVGQRRQPEGVRTPADTTNSSSNATGMQGADRWHPTAPA